MPPRKAAQKTKGAKATPSTAPAVNGVKRAPLTNGYTPPQEDEPVPKATTKRRRVVEEDEPKETAASRKKAKTVAHAKEAKVERVSKPVASQKPPAALNTRSSQKLDIFVFGSGNFGELGLGHKKFEGKSPEDVKRPRLNHNLLADKVGVVQVSCGGMHAIALTADNTVLTWGVNDDKALGRESSWGEESDAGSDDESDCGLDRAESTPAEVDLSVAGTRQFVQVAASNSASFILTDDGLVYGWGTFRDTNGIFGFTQDVEVQSTPMQISGLTNITALSAGSNHVLALDKEGKVWSWGSNSQLQLGRKRIARHGGPRATLEPMLCGHFTKKNYAVKISTGAFHSFYIDNKGMAWSWGLNNFSQTGHSHGSGNSDALVAVPTKVAGLENITQIDGGEHHSAACRADGALLAWGRIDSHQVGLSKDLLTDENTTYDEKGRPRIVSAPTVIPDLNASFVATGTETTIAITPDGKAYSWGFSANYQTGLGTEDDVEVPTLIEPRRVQDKKLVWAGTGGQFSMLASAH